MTDDEMSKKLDVMERRVALLERRIESHVARLEAELARLHEKILGLPPSEKPAALLENIQHVEQEIQVLSAENRARRQ